MKREEIMAGFAMGVPAAAAAAGHMHPAWEGERKKKRKKNKTEKRREDGGKVSVFSVAILANELQSDWASSSLKSLVENESP